MTYLRLGFVVALVGCGGASDKSVAPTAATFQTLLAEAGCEGGVQCGLVLPTAIAQCKVDSKAKATAATAYDRAAAAAAGRLTFDAAQAKQCLAAAKSPPNCSISYQFFGTDCMHIFGPAVADGGACNAHEECKSGTCVGSTTAGCAGTCAVPVADGESCDNVTAFCGARSKCVAASDGDTMGTCTRLPSLDEPCSASSDCEDQYWCRGTLADPSDKRCRPGGAVGELCNYYLFTNCAGNLTCDVQDYQTYDGVCKALSPTGGTCADLFDCAPGAACAGLVLNDDYSVKEQGTCTPWLAEGAACDPTAAYTACPMTHICNATTSTCTPAPSGVDADCATRFCADGLYCNNDHVCKVPVPFGGTCVAADGSVSGEEPCAEGTCVAGACTLACGSS